MFSYQETALTIHPLAQRALVLLALRSYEAKNERRKMWEWKEDADETSDGRGKREEERGGSKKRKKHSKFKVSSHKSKAQPMTNHSTSYTPTHNPTVLTFMVAFTLRPLSRWAAVLLMSWLLIDFCVREPRREQQRLGWWSRRTSRRRGEKRCTSGPRVLLKTSRLFYVSFKRGAGRRAKFKSLSRRPTKPLSDRRFLVIYVYVT